MTPSLFLAFCAIWLISGSEGKEGGISSVVASGCLILAALFFLAGY
jgi:hypothetical protein